MKSARRTTGAAALAVVGLTSLMVVTIINPRIDQLRTATTSFGSALLSVVLLLVAIAPLVPALALGQHRSRPLLASAVVLALGTGLVLSFDHRDGSDGLFVGTLLAGAMLLLAISAAWTRNLRRRD